MRLMSGFEREEGPRFGPLRPGHGVSIPDEAAGLADAGAPGGDDAAPSFGLGSVAAWLAAGIASVSAAALLLMTWAGSADAGTQTTNTVVVGVSWVGLMLLILARDHGRALRVFNLLALVCSLIFVAIVVLVIIQFLRLAGES